MIFRYLTYCVFLVLLSSHLANGEEETGEVPVALFHNFLHAAPSGTINFVKDDNDQLFARIGTFELFLGTMNPVDPPPPPQVTYATLNSVDDWEENSHPTDAAATDNSGVMICSVRNAQFTRRCQLNKWSLPGTNPFNYLDQDFFPETGCWFTVEMRIPQPISNITWLDCFGLNSAVGGRFGTHAPLCSLTIFEDPSGDQGVSFWNQRDGFAQGQITFPVGQWIKLELYVETDPTLGFIECWAGGELLGQMFGETSYNNVNFPIFWIGNFGQYGSGQWTDIEFRNATVTLNRTQ